MTHHMNRKDVPPCILDAYPGYKGDHIQVVLSESVDLSGAFWDGGSRSTYLAVVLATGAIAPPDVRLMNPPQFGGPRETPTVTLPPGVVIVEHVISCGRDRGLRIHARPEDFRPLLPAPTDLSDAERKCLEATCAYKSSYGGNSNYRQENSGLDPATWKAAQASLQAKGFLNKVGAVTTAGRNARSAGK